MADYKRRDSPGQDNESAQKLRLFDILTAGGAGGTVTLTNAEKWAGSVIEREVEGSRKECPELGEQLSP